MVMEWKNSTLRKLLNIMHMILVWNAVLQGSITFLVIMQHGKVVERKHLLHFAEKFTTLRKVILLRCGEMENKLDHTVISMIVLKVFCG